MPSLPNASSDFLKFLQSKNNSSPCEAPKQGQDNSSLKNPTDALEGLSNSTAVAPLQPTNKTYSFPYNHDSSSFHFLHSFNVALNAPSERL